MLEILQFVTKDIPTLIMTFILISVVGFWLTFIASELTDITIRRVTKEENDDTTCTD